MWSRQPSTAITTALSQQVARSSQLSNPRDALSMLLALPALSPSTPLASKTEADVTSIMQEFQTAVEAGKEKESGFPSAAYAVSKAGLIGGTRVLANEVREKGSSVQVNSCCPGYVNTDMSKGNGTKTPDEGAQTPVWLAIQDFGGKTGTFYKGEKEIEWQNL
jgi:carbonyl reductase 1